MEGWFDVVNEGIQDAAEWVTRNNPVSYIIDEFKHDKEGRRAFRARGRRYDRQPISSLVNSYVGPHASQEKIQGKMFRRKNKISSLNKSRPRNRKIYNVFKRRRPRKSVRKTKVGYKRRRTRG